MRTPPRAPRLAPAVLIALLALAGSITPVAAWSNRGDDYGTHDWILDQALRLLDVRGIGHAWVDRTIALHATDDPDTIEVAADPARKIEHVYTGEGRRGGAIHRITEGYAKILRLYAAHRYKAASYQLGLLAHFWGDIAQPYHTDRAALQPDAEAEHHPYELLVTDLTRARRDMPGWSVAKTDWQVRAMPNVRAAALELAAYSRARFGLVHDNFEPSDTVLSPIAWTVTGEVLRQASGGLANLIRSVPKGIGNAPPVGTLEMWTRWRGVQADETGQYVYGRVRDVHGDLVEGVRVDVTYPTADGLTATAPFWTDETGVGRVAIEVGRPDLMQRVGVAGRVKTNQTKATAAEWYYRTEPLADGSEGFRTDVSDRSVATGQEVVVTTTVRTPDGRPIEGLLIDWTWMLADTPMLTTGYTNSDGIATASYLIQDDTTAAQVYVYAHTSAYSTNRRSKTWFQRAS